MVFTEIIIGAFLAIGCLLIFRQAPDKLSKAFFSKTLILAAFIYVVFAFIGFFRGLVSIGWVGVELIGLALFLIFAVYGKRKSILILSFGWLLHTAWDIGLHYLPNSAFVPSFYPMLCLGFDLVFGMFLLYNFFISFKE